MILYTDRFVPRGFAAITLGPVILMRPDRWNDAGLIAHEQVHVRQFWQSWGMFWFWYLLVPQARLDYEVEAFQEQLKYNPECLDSFATELATKYRLRISVEEAARLLKGE
jgi:hypothetical protein